MSAGEQGCAATPAWLWQYPGRLPTELLGTPHAAETAFCHQQQKPCLHDRKVPLGGSQLGPGAACTQCHAFKRLAGYGHSWLTSW